MQPCVFGDYKIHGLPEKRAIGLRVTRRIYISEFDSLRAWLSLVEWFVLEVPRAEEGHRL